MFGYPDGMWAKQLRQLGNMPGMTEEEKRGQGQALPELMEMPRGPPEFSTKEKGQPLVQHSEKFRAVGDPHIRQGKVLPERKEMRE